MVKAPYYDKNGVKKGAWSLEEDNKLRAYVQRYGYWNWRELPKFAGINLYFLQKGGRELPIRKANNYNDDK